jgi:hypothetical protein
MASCTCPKKSSGTFFLTPVNLLCLGNFLSRLSDEFTPDNLTDEDVELGRSLGMRFLEKTKDELDFMLREINLFLGRVFLEANDVGYMKDDGKEVDRLVFTDSFQNSIIVIRSISKKNVCQYRISTSQLLTLAYKNEIDDSFCLEVKINDKNGFEIIEHSWNKICKDNIIEINLGRSKIVFESKPDNVNSTNPKDWDITLTGTKIGKKVPKRF